MGCDAVTVLVSSFDAGRRDWRMGAGPQQILATGLLEVLAADGVDTRSIEIEARDALPSELSRGFAVQREIADATADALSEGRLPILLSGDCNSSLGVVAGAQRNGASPAFVWCDAHADFHTPETDRFGSLDCQGLAMLTGRAWEGLVRETGLRPLPDSHVALVGARAVDPEEEVALTASGMTRLAVAEVANERKRDNILGGLMASGATSVHLHVDADVLDSGIAPANDYAVPGGLQLEELLGLFVETISRLPLGSLSIASYDPRLDADRALARALVDVIRRVVRFGDDAGAS